MSASATIPDELISAFKATVAGIGSKSKDDVKFTDLWTAFSKISDRRKESIDNITRVTSQMPGLTTYLFKQELDDVEECIKDLESHNGTRVRRLFYKTDSIRTQTETRFSQSVGALEEACEVLDVMEKSLRNPTSTDGLRAALTTLASRNSKAATLLALWPTVES